MFIEIKQPNNNFFLNLNAISTIKFYENENQIEIGLHSVNRFDDHKTISLNFDNNNMGEYQKIKRIIENNLLK